MTETLSSVLPEFVERQVREVLEVAGRHGLSIATAESCTGGLLSAALTDVKGSSGVFERGYVVYSPESKCELLQVDRADLERCGPVSREVAVAMAEGARRASHADLAVAVTGFADEGDRPGLVHLACACDDRPTAHREEHFGHVGRGPVRIESVRVALAMLREAISDLTG